MTWEIYYDLWLKALNGIVDTLNAGLEQAPAYVVDLVSRYWIYVWTSHLVYALIALAVWIWSYFIWKYVYNVCVKEWEDDVAMTWLTMFFAFIWIIAFVIFAVQIWISIKWYTLPEVSLIQDITWVWGCSRCK